jgi:ribosomal protein L37AE/L43A
MIAPQSIGPAFLRRERTLQPWRIALVLFTLFIIITSHWPGQAPEAIEPRHYFPDKLIHFLAFGGFVMLLWLSGWIRSWWIVSLAGMGFVLIDEWTQSIFATNRHASGEDLVAGMLGVLTASGWMTALAAPAPRALETRNRRQSFAMETLFEQTSNMLRVALAGAVPLLLVAVLTYAIAWTLLGASYGNLALTLGLVAALVSMGIYLRRRMSSIFDAMSEQWPCFACGNSMKELAPDEDGLATCSVCGEAAHCSQWIHLVMPKTPLQMLIKADGISGTACLMLYLLLGLIFAPYALLVSDQSGLAGAILYTSVGLITAMMWAWRHYILGSWLKSMGTRCAQCGSDLIGLEVDRGLGQCPQCRTDFARFGRLQDDEEGGANGVHTPSNA